MTLQNSDNFVVNRSSVNYSIESEKLVATLQDEDMFYKCADVFISLAEKQRMIVTERECSCCDFDQIIDKL